jgi:hypothetical protein
MMDERTDYQVLAPDSVAWYIQAALVADRTDNVAARDLALDEARRIAEERQLTPDPGYDCRTTGGRLAVLEDRLQILSDTMRRIVAEIDNRLDALEAWRRHCKVAPGYNHSDGRWITCPFCVDDPLGMCSACNGTRRIWEMPREDE